MTSTRYATAADLAAAVAALPRTADSHPFVEHSGKGCQECGKNRNGKAHTVFHRAAQSARQSVIAELGIAPRS